MLLIIALVMLIIDVVGVVGVLVGSKDFILGTIQNLALPRLTPSNTVWVNGRAHTSSYVCVDLFFV